MHHGTDTRTRPLKFWSPTALHSVVFLGLDIISRITFYRYCAIQDHETASKQNSKSTSGCTHFLLTYLLIIIIIIIVICSAPIYI